MYLNYSLSLNYNKKIYNKKKKVNVFRYLNMFKQSNFKKRKNKMELSKIIGAIIISAILAGISVLGISFYTSYSNVQGLKGSVNLVVDTAYTYLSESPTLGSYSGITLSNLSFASSSVVDADNAVYKYKEQISVDSDGEVTVQDAGGTNTTFTGVPFLSDTDTSSTITNADGSANAVSADTVVMLDGAKPGLFLKVAAGDGTNGGTAGSAVFDFSVATGSGFSTQEKAKFESSFRTARNVTIINGTSATDGVFKVVVAPN